jgi:hypothetical protein
MILSRSALQRPVRAENAVTSCDLRILVGKAARLMSSPNADVVFGDFWVHPLPPRGPVFIASWLAYGMPETLAVDGAVLGRPPSAR